MEIRKDVYRHVVVTEDDFRNASMNSWEEGRIIMLMIQKLEDHFIKEMRQFEDYIKEAKKKKVIDDSTKTLIRTWWGPNAKACARCLLKLNKIKLECTNANKTFSAFMKTRSITHPERKVFK